jgi:hypothetical protein
MTKIRENPNPATHTRRADEAPVSAWLNVAPTHKDKWIKPPDPALINALLRYCFLNESNPDLKMGRLLQKIVRNEAMKDDPPEIYSVRIFLLALSVSMPSLRHSHRLTCG